jgi:signal transduction histidine kinase
LPRIKWGLTSQFCPGGISCGTSRAKEATMSLAASDLTTPTTSILLVADDLADLLFLESILTSLGQNLVRARSGKEALQKLGASDFAVVLLAVQMAGLDGFQTARHIRGRPESSHIPIIFLTASHSIEFPILDAYQLGAVDYLVKPYVPEVLRAKVKALVEIYQKTEQVRRQAERLRQMEKVAFEQKIREAQQQWEMERLRRDASADRKIADALREADRHKDEFLAMLAHELRNPLSPIRNAVHILKQPDTDPATLQEAREMIERQAQHMGRLLDDLLDVSRISQGRIELRRELVDLVPIIKGSVEAVRPLNEIRRLELSVTLPTEPLWVQGDQTRLEQVLTNLLNNAAKYTDPGGQISLSAELRDGTVVVSIRDTGIGIAPDLLPRVFDLFVQGDRRSDRSGGGLGIGLTLVKKLVQLHGGTVEAFSRGSGQGSEFAISLPAFRHNQAHAGAAAPSRDSSAPAPPVRRILVVDDNEDAANSLATLLRLKDQNVRVAHDGTTALAAAESFRPDVVFLDIGMPAMDGYEVARRLRGQPEGSKALLVALTGWGQADDRARSQDAGFDYHVVKPVEPDTLQLLLDRADETMKKQREAF